MASQSRYGILCGLSREVIAKDTLFRYIQRGAGGQAGGHRDRKQHPDTGKQTQTGSFINIRYARR